MLISKGALGVTTQMHSSSRALSTLSSSNYFSKTRSTHPNKISQARNIVGLVDAIDKRVYRWAKGVMPPISQTEQIALGSGTIGFDRDIFTGSPSLQHLVDTYEPKLSPEEEVFINEKVDKLCSLLNDHDVSMSKDFTKEAWDYMRSERFFGMKIPKEWGGLGFSTHAVSQVLAKLATHCFDANATVAVPNSLGPGELLARYGTVEQKEYFMPRLADGTLIPCFGLTGPHSGSDATSLIGSSCVVEKRDGELGVRASFNKRYITLAPIAGVVGLGLNLSDPEGLLGEKGSEGFTVALLE
jgi:acyl-CoA dehydrogenase